MGKCWIPLVIRPNQKPQIRFGICLLRWPGIFWLNFIKIKGFVFPWSRQLYQTKLLFDLLLNLSKTLESEKWILLGRSLFEIINTFFRAIRYEWYATVIAAIISRFPPAVKIFENFGRKIFVDILEKNPDRIFEWYNIC